MHSPSSEADGIEPLRSPTSLHRRVSALSRQRSSSTANNGNTRRSSHGNAPASPLLGFSATLTVRRMAQAAKILTHLKKSPLFNAVSHNEAHRHAVMQKLARHPSVALLKYPHRTVIGHQSSHPSLAHFVIAGKVRIVTDGLVLSEGSSGEIVGADSAVFSTEGFRRWRRTLWNQRQALTHGDTDRLFAESILARCDSDDALQWKFCDEVKNRKRKRKMKFPLFASVECLEQCEVIVMPKLLLLESLHSDHTLRLHAYQFLLSVYWMRRLAHQDGESRLCRVYGHPTTDDGEPILDSAVIGSMGFLVHSLRSPENDSEEAALSEARHKLSASIDRQSHEFFYRHRRPGDSVRVKILGNSATNEKAQKREMKEKAMAANRANKVKSFISAMERSRRASVSAHGVDGDDDSDAEYESDSDSDDSENDSDNDSASDTVVTKGSVSSPVSVIYRSAIQQQVQQQRQSPKHTLRERLRQPNSQQSAPSNVRLSRPLSAPVKNSDCSGRLGVVSSPYMQASKRLTAHHHTPSSRSLAFHYSMTNVAETIADAISDNGRDDEKTQLVLPPTHYLPLFEDQPQSITHTNNIFKAAAIGASTEPHRWALQGDDEKAQFVVHNNSRDYRHHHCDGEGHAVTHYHTIAPTPQHQSVTELEASIESEYLTNITTRKPAVSARCATIGSNTVDRARMESEARMAHSSKFQLSLPQPDSSTNRASTAREHARSKRTNAAASLTSRPSAKQSSSVALSVNSLMLAASNRSFSLATRLSFLNEASAMTNSRNTRRHTSSSEGDNDDCDADCESEPVSLSSTQQKPSPAGNKFPFPQYTAAYNIHTSLRPYTATMQRVISKTGAR